MAKTTKRRRLGFKNTVERAVKAFAVSTKDPIKISDKGVVYVSEIMRHVTTGVNKCIASVIGKRKTVNDTVMRIAFIKFFMDHGVALEVLTASGFLNSIDDHMETHWDEYEKSYKECVDEEEEEEEGDESDAEEEEDEEEEDED